METGIFEGVPAELRQVLLHLALLGLLGRFDAQDPREEFHSPADRVCAAMVGASHLPVEVTTVGLDALAARAGLSPATLVQLRGYAGGGPGRDADGRPLAFGERAHYAATYRRTDDLYRLRADLQWRANSQWDARAVWVFRPAGWAQSPRPAICIEYVRRGVSHRAYVEYGRAPRGAEYYRQIVADYSAHSAVPVLFFTLTRRNEDTLADMLQRVLEEPGGRPILLATLYTAFHHPEGMLGPIWRTPWSAERVWWVPPTRVEDISSLRGWEES